MTQKADSRSDRAGPKNSASQVSQLSPRVQRDAVGGQLGGFEERSSGPEEFGFPSLPIVPPRRPFALGPCVGTGLFAIMVIADMDDEINMARDAALDHPCERPGIRIVAALPLIEIGRASCRERV